jgi:hypothetical protein
VSGAWVCRAWKSAIGYQADIRACSVCEGRVFSRVAIDVIFHGHIYFRAWYYPLSPEPPFLTCWP